MFPFLDVAQFDSIDWVECPNGLFFYGFLGQHGDGLIKVLPGGSKGKSRTKKSTLVRFYDFFKEKIINFLIFIEIRNPLRRSDFYHQQ